MTYHASDLSHDLDGDDADGHAATRPALRVQPVFYDRSLGWEMAVRRILSPLQHEHVPLRSDDVAPNIPGARVGRVSDSVG